MFLVSILTPTTLEPELQEKNQNYALINRILRGESRLFHDLVRPYEKGLYLAANALLRNHADSEDAVQEAVLKAFTHLHQLSSPEKFRSWIFRILINEAHLKRRNSHSHLFESLEGEGEHDREFIPRDFADWREDALESMERTEIREAVAKALESLPEIYREIFVLRDVRELTVAECSEILGVTAEVVKVRLHRARLMIREKLAPIFKLSWHERVCSGKGENYGGPEAMLQRLARISSPLLLKRNCQDGPTARGDVPAV
jgi:RNA polymerase sigma-70 factor (ECF subfamily)